MSFVIGTFVLVFAIVAGLYWGLIDRPEAQENLAVRRRVRKAVAPGQFTKALQRERERLSDVEFLNTALESAGRIVVPLQRMIAQSGIKTTVGALLLSCLCAA